MASSTGLHRTLWSVFRAPSRHSLKPTPSISLPRHQHRSLHARGVEFLQTHDPDLTETQRTVRTAISKICANFPDAYWAEAEASHRFPIEFQQAIARDGWLGICMPAAFGGSELGIAEAATMMQTISESGGAYAACSAIHMNIFGLEPVRKFGTLEQKRRMLSPLVAGKERACFGVTEPNTGLDTLKLQSRAVKAADGKSYVLSGSKIWTSTAQVAEKILILVRTTPLELVEKRSQGLSLFYTDLDREKVQVTEIPKMGRAAVDSNILFFEDWVVPAEDLIGDEGAGFKMIMHGMNVSSGPRWFPAQFSSISAQLVYILRCRTKAMVQTHSYTQICRHKPFH
jgi:alkylation response protein AidB-like acyl-CoA dehydrogenase